LEHDPRDGEFAHITLPLEGVLHYESAGGGSGPKLPETPPSAGRSRRSTSSRQGQGLALYVPIDGLIERPSA